MTDPIDWRALCADLLEQLAKLAGADPHHKYLDLITRTRLALAQPEPQGPSDEELLGLWEQWNVGWDPQRGPVITPHPVEFARAVLARYGRPAIEPVPQQEVE